MFDLVKEAIELRKTALLAVRVSKRSQSLGGVQFMNNFAVPYQPQTVRVARAGGTFAAPRDGPSTASNPTAISVSIPSGV